MLRRTGEWIRLAGVNKTRDVFSVYDGGHLCKPVTEACQSDSNRTSLKDISLSNFFVLNYTLSIVINREEHIALIILQYVEMCNLIARL